jgi:hypothetical protein
MLCVAEGRVWRQWWGVRRWNEMRWNRFSHLERSGPCAGEAQARQCN